MKFKNAIYHCIKTLKLLGIVLQLPPCVWVKHPGQWLIFRSLLSFAIQKAHILALRVPPILSSSTSLKPSMLINIFPILKNTIFLNLCIVSLSWFFQYCQKKFLINFLDCITEWSSWLCCFLSPSFKEHLQIWLFNYMYCIKNELIL